MGSSRKFDTTPDRSSLMRKIRSKGTKPEVILRKALWAQGFRYRLNVENLPGCPDIVFKKYKLVIFVDGEFWHGFNWEQKKHKIKSNSEYWLKKIEGNINRDKKTQTIIEGMGYQVLRFWELDIRKNTNTCIKEIANAIYCYNLTANS